MSGGSFPGGAAESLLGAPGPSIEKPFKAADLQAVVDGVLNG